MEINKDTKIKVPTNYISDKKRANVQKYLTLAKNTFGEEKMKHLKKADKLLTRYGL